MIKKEFHLKVGLFGIGLEAYWDQFEGLKNRLVNYIRIAEEKIKSYQCEVVNLGLIDTSEKAILAGHEFRKADVDIIFLYVTMLFLICLNSPILLSCKTYLRIV